MLNGENLNSVYSFYILVELIVICFPEHRVLHWFSLKNHSSRFRVSVTFGKGHTAFHTLSQLFGSRMHGNIVAQLLDGIFSVGLRE